jgi:hypothetical protein
LTVGSAQLVGEGGKEQGKGVEGYDKTVDLFVMKTHVPGSGTLLKSGEKGGKEIKIKENLFCTLTKRPLGE